MRKELTVVLLAGVFASSAAFAKVGGGDIKFMPSGAASVVYSHELHVAKGMKCSDCHYRIFNTVAETRKRFSMAEMQKGMSCGACHNGTRAFDVKTDCAKCHTGD